MYVWPLVRAVIERASRWLIIHFIDDVNDWLYLAAARGRLLLVEHFLRYNSSICSQNVRAGMCWLVVILCGLCFTHARADRGTDTVTVKVSQVLLCFNFHFQVLIYLASESSSTVSFSL